MASSARTVQRATWMLAALDGLIALILTIYVVAPPVAGSPRQLDSALAVGLWVMAALVLLAMPRAPWLQDPLLAATWVSIAVLSATRPTPTGQVALGAFVVLTALYAAYFTRGVRFALHLTGMTAGYLVIRVADPLTATTFFAVFIAGIAVLTGIVVHGLRQTDARYRTLVENSADVIVQSRKGVIAWVSPAVERMLGWTPEEMTGRTVEDIFHPDDVPGALKARARTRTGEQASGVLRARHRDGHFVSIEFSAKPLPGSRSHEMVASWRDVSDRVAAEEAAHRLEAVQREEALRKAKAAESKARLFQNISHELRTPLAIISGPLQDMQRHGDLSATDRAGLDSAVRASMRMERLVDGLLQIAQGQSGQLRVRPEPTDVPAVTRGTIDMFVGMAKQLGLTIETRIGPVPRRVMIDPEVWTTVVVNVVSNALKYTRQGTVVVEVAYEAGTAELVVTDPGVGIAPSALPHVFERFEQSPSQPVHGEPGSGIGLALVAQLVGAAGGRHQVDSAQGVGTTVRIWIPAPACVGDAGADSDHHLDVAAHRQAWAWTARTNRDQQGGAPDADDAEVPVRGCILVAEDNDDLRSYLANLLTGSGWRVTAVPDAESALPLVGSHDLLLSDVMLPGESGIDLVRRVRSGEGDSRWLPIVLLTARADDSAVLAGLRAGADDYVTKPFSPPELLARIATHVELALLRQVVVDQATDRAENLERALGSNRTIGTALGIIMATQKVSPDEAFIHLRSASQRSNRKLREVADEVVYTGALPA